MTDEAITKPVLTLDLRLCHGEGMCVPMRRDIEACEARKGTREIVARTMEAVMSGRCAHCGRRVR